MLITAGLWGRFEEEGWDVSEVLLDEEGELVEGVVLASCEFGECLLEGKLDVYHAAGDECGVYLGDLDGIGCLLI